MTVMDGHHSRQNAQLLERNIRTKVRSTKATTWPGHADDAHVWQSFILFSTSQYMHQQSTYLSWFNYLLNFRYGNKVLVYHSINMGQTYINSTSSSSTSVKRPRASLLYNVAYFM
jgi:hypothetical protein